MYFFRGRTEKTFTTSLFYKNVLVPSAEKGLVWSLVQSSPLIVLVACCGSLASSLCDLIGGLPDSDVPDDRTDLVSYSHRANKYGYVVLNPIWRNHEGPSGASVPLRINVRPKKGCKCIATAATTGKRCGNTTLSVSGRCWRHIDNKSFLRILIQAQSFKGIPSANMRKVEE